MARAAGCSGTGCLGGRGRGPIRKFWRGWRSTQRSLEEALRGSRVTAGGEQKINRSAGGIDGAVQVYPSCPSPERRSHPPARSRWWASAPGGIVVQFGRVALNPTPDSGVAGGDAPLGEEFLDVPIGQGESQMPATAQVMMAGSKWRHLNKDGRDSHTNASYQGRVRPFPPLQHFLERRKPDLRVLKTGTSSLTDSAAPG